MQYASMEPTSLIGTSFGAYRIQATLGKGGMAWVYKAYHAELQREAAIKIILPERANRPDFQTLFRQEAQLVAKLEHRHIITVYDFGTIVHPSPPHIKKIVVPAPRSHTRDWLRFIVTLLILLLVIVETLVKLGAIH